VDFVTTEPVAQTVRKPPGEPVVAAGKALGECLVDQRQWHLLFEGLLDCPGARRPTGDVVGHVPEVVALLAERFLTEFE
jgi:hypothetical protein